MTGPGRSFFKRLKARRITSDTFRQIQRLHRPGHRRIGARRAEEREDLGLILMPQRQEQHRVESENAVATPGKAFSAPGPYCIANTPTGFPLVIRLYPSAMPTQPAPGRRPGDGCRRPRRPG